MEVLLPIIRLYFILTLSDVKRLQEALQANFELRTWLIEKRPGQ